MLKNVWHEISLRFRGLCTWGMQEMCKKHEEHVHVVKLNEKNKKKEQKIKEGKNNINSGWSMFRRTSAISIDVRRKMKNRSDRTTIYDSVLTLDRATTHFYRMPSPPCDR